MAEPIVNRWQPELPVEASTEYFPETGTLYVDRGKPFGEGETIAKNLVVFFDQDNENEVIGIMIEHAETVLKPFVDAMLAKHGVSRGPT